MMMYVDNLSYTKNILLYHQLWPLTYMYECQIYDDYIKIYSLNIVELWNYVYYYFSIYGF